MDACDVQDKVIFWIRGAGCLTLRVAHLAFRDTDFSPEQRDGAARICMVRDD
jgi:hypothetical protein